MRLHSYTLLCDDFYAEMVMNTKLGLPTERDTILAFFERIQKRFPSMGCFYRRAKNEYCLEEDTNPRRYRWITIGGEHIGCGVVNPARFEDAYCQARLVLELVPYMLSVSHLDIDSLDVTFGMDFGCSGSHDEVIAEALFGGTALSCLLDLPGASAVDFSPTIVVGLSDDRLTQARITVESKTGVGAAGRGMQKPDEAISLSFTVRQYSSSSGRFDALGSFERQCKLAEELMAEKIVPNLVQPLTSVIAQKGLA